jgi:hypothetical protein
MNDSSDNADGVHFDISRNSWVPRDDCGQHILPALLPPEAAPFVCNRQLLRDVRLQDNSGILTPYVSESGFLEGPDCIPRISQQNFPSCGSCWGVTNLIPSGIFILRTYGGAVIRQKRALVCACGETVSWRPEDEYIHTIRNQSEGGIHQSKTF